MIKLDELLTRGVEKVLPSKKGLESFMQKKKIRVYLGVDPTGNKLHLGHTIPLRKLQGFADLGHEAILLVGTGTVLAGDPSQREQARVKITQDEIQNNIKTWREQTSKIINFDKVQIKYNGDWLLKLRYTDIINIAARISAIQLFKRDTFRERIKRGDTVWTHEALYPLFQGYDSVVMDVDLEIGGTDQTFNMLIGRELQKKINNREKYVLTTPLILGTDGKPMSKTSGNCIWLDDPPRDMFGKIMSMADSQIEEYVINLTDMELVKLKRLKLLDAKKKLAREVVKLFHSEEAAKRAQEEFERVFQKRQKPQDIKEVKVKKPKWKVPDFLVEYNLVESKSAAKRLFDQKAIEINGKVVKENEVEFKGGETIRVGKKTFAKIILEQ